MEINTRNEINGKMCYVCNNTFVQFKKIKYYIDLWGNINQVKPRVICCQCKINRENVEYHWLAFKLGCELSNIG